METQKILNSQSNLEEDKQSWRNQSSRIQTIFQRFSHQEYDTGTKAGIDQWNKTESPEINPCTYGYLNFEKGGRDIQWRRDSGAG